MNDILADLEAAAARKWYGDPEAQQADLFARAAAEIERLRTERETLRTLVEAVREANAAAQTDGQFSLLTHAQEMAWRRLIDALDGPNVRVEPPRAVGSSEGLERFMEKRDER